MATPTQQATEIFTSIVNGTSFRINFTKGNGARRLVTVTEGTDEVSYPVDGVQYNGSLKFKEGDALESPITGSGSCAYAYPYPDPIVASQSESLTKTFVVYEGLSDGVSGLDVIKLNYNTYYQIMVFEHNHYCYTDSSIFTIKTGFETNESRMDLYVFDNRTRSALPNADIVLVNAQGFISDFGLTDENGMYLTTNLQEGRYELSVVCPNYEYKIIGGLFIQRTEPRRDNYYRIFSSAGNTEVGGSVEREYYKNNNIHRIYLDPLNIIAKSYVKYAGTTNPSNLTKL